VSDYAYDTRESLDGRIAELDERARDARAEADHARKLPGLEGPAKNAEDEAVRLEAQVADLRQIAARVERGYPYWERNGFEEAVDACGDARSWQPLSERVDDGLISATLPKASGFRSTSRAPMRVRSRLVFLTGSRSARPSRQKATPFSVARSQAHLTDMSLPGGQPLVLGRG
jgi:hypothetical protein